MLGVGRGERPGGPRREQDPVSRALKLVCRTGLISPYVLSASLGISLDEAEALIGAMLAHGYIAEHRVEGCGSCPLRSICPYSGRTQRISVFRLTRRGKEACGSLGNP